MMHHRVMGAACSPVCHGVQAELIGTPGLASFSLVFEWGRENKKERWVRKCRAAHDSADRDATVNGKNDAKTAMQQVGQAARGVEKSLGSHSSVALWSLASRRG